MTEDRLLNKLDEVTSKLNEVSERLAVLEARHESADKTIKLLGWLLVFAVTAAGTLGQLVFNHGG